MTLARRKNMMSMSGMISIRACFLGIGEVTSMALFRHRSDVEVTFLLRFEHNFKVRRRGLQLEL
jgi:hypothetical protein